MSYVHFSGPCKWARLTTPDQKFVDKKGMGKYTLALGLDTKQYMELQKLKLRNAGKLDESGLFWVNFNRNEGLGPPKVVDKEGKPVTDFLGNGSEITVELEIKSWTSKDTGGTQYAATLVGVRVDNLVPYEKKEQPAGVGASAPVSAAAPSPLVTPKRIF